MENALKKMDKEWWRFDEKLKYKGSNESTEYVKKPYKQQVQLFLLKNGQKINGLLVIQYQITKRLRSNK